MLQFFHTWFGFGPVVSEEDKGGRVLEAEARAREPDDFARPYSEVQWKNLPDNDLKQKRLQRTVWGTSHHLDLMWSRTDVSEPNDVKILPGDRLAFVDSGEEKLTVCKLHDGADEHCFKPTSALSPFKPLSLVVDEHSNIKVYNKTTNTVCTWQGKPNWRDLGKWRDAHRAFGSMRGMCKDFKQIIYIVDSSEGCVSAHHTDGKRIRTFGRGKLKRPACVGSDHLGRIYVTDEKDCSVSVFDEMGNFIFKFGSEGEDQGQFMGPTGIAVDPQGNVFVADTLNNRISVLAPDGRFKHHLVADSDIMRPSGIDLSSDGLLAVTSQYITFRSVSVFKLR